MIIAKRYHGRWNQRINPEVFVEEHAVEDGTDLRFGAIEWHVSQRPLAINAGRSSEVGSFITPPHGIASAFQWGYRGMGPQQLAFSILYDTFGDQGFAFKNIQTFVDKMIATFPQGSRWKIYQGANSLSSGSLSLTKIGDRLV